MKWEPFTSAELRERLEYDPALGTFRRRDTGAAVGWPDTQGYITIYVRRFAEYRAHRLAWLYMTGAWPQHHIDHLNGDRLDNRWANLRDVSQQLNNQNRRRAAPHSKSGFLGVVKASTNRWSAYIGGGEGKRYLGMFKTPEEAHQAYVEAKRAAHQGCTL